MSVAKIILLVLNLSFLMSTVHADLPSQLKDLKESLGQLKTNLNTLNTKFGELKEKLESGQFISKDQIKFFNTDLTLGRSYDGQSNTLDFSGLGRDRFFQQDSLNEVTYILLSECTFNSTRTYVFHNLSKFKSLELVKAQNLKRLSLANNPNLETIKLEECNEFIHLNVEKCDKLKKVIFNNCAGLLSFQILENQGFNTVTELDFSRCSNLNNVLIQELSNLELVDLSGCSSLDANNIHFINLKNLKTITLPRSLKTKSNMIINCDSATIKLVD